MRPTIESQITAIMNRLKAGGMSDREELAAFNAILELKREEQRNLPPSEPHMPRAWIRPFDTPGRSETHGFAIERAEGVESRSGVRRNSCQSTAMSTNEARGAVPSSWPTLLSSNHG